jgi:amino acid transporter
MGDQGTSTTSSGGVMTRSQAVFIGVGAMVGAGIFTLLGEAGKIAQSAVWVSFLAAGLIAMLQGYSSVYLGKKYASSAGLVGYIGAGFGRGGRVTSTLAWVVWAATVIVIAMVATSFGTYGAALFTGGGQSATLIKLLATAIVAGIVVLSSLGGAKAVAKAQAVLVRLVIIILMAIAAVTIFTADWTLLAPSTYPPASDIVGSIALTFFAFLGFNMISFTAKDLKDQNDLGPASYIAVLVAIAIYVAVSLGVFGQLTPKEAADAGAMAIALAVKPVLGQIGYVIVAITAMLSTAGAINANLYAAPGLLGTLAGDGTLPTFFGAKRGKYPASLLVTAALILVFVWMFDLSAIASLGSAVALFIFLIISIGHIRIRKQTGANLAMLVLGGLAVVVTLLSFFATTLKTSPTSLIAFVVLVVLAVIADTIWRAVRTRRSAAA